WSLGAGTSTSVALPLAVCQEPLSSLYLMLATPDAEIAGSARGTGARKSTLTYARCQLTSALSLSRGWSVSLITVRVCVGLSALPRLSVASHLTYSTLFRSWSLGAGTSTSVALPLAVCQEPLSSLYLMLATPDGKKPGSFALR